VLAGCKHRRERGTYQKKPTKKKERSRMQPQKNKDTDSERRTQPLTNRDAAREAKRTQPLEKQMGTATETGHKNKLQRIQPVH
jgi:hypothetical protein